MMVGGGVSSGGGNCNNNNNNNNSSSGEEGLKKIRKPYTITKSRESWTEQEHDKFLEALQLFDRDWKKIEAFVGSKSVIQIRSHAQKYFLKVQKNGSGEHVPPPRPKRKSAQPYPQKASKLGLIASMPHSTSGLPVSTLPADSGYSLGSQSGGPYISQETSGQQASWIHHGPSSGTIASGMIGPTGINDNNSDESSADVWSLPVNTKGVSHDICLKAETPNAPDFAEIYKFIGSTFDPGVSGHLTKLKEMAPIDRETIMLLMRNLSLNLSSPEFEENKLLSSVPDIEEQKPSIATSLDGQVGQVGVA